MAAVEQDITAEQGAALAVTLTGAGASLQGRTLRMHVRSKVGVTTTKLVAGTGDGRLTVGADPYTTAALAIGSDVMAAVSVTLPVEYWVYDVESYTTAADVRREWSGRFTISRDVTRDTEADTEDSLAGLVRYDTPQSLTDAQMIQARANIDFAESVRDLVGTTLVAGSNVTITVSDAGDTITIASSGGGGGGTWGSITGTLSAQTDLAAALALKAPLASPTLTGTPAAPTAAGGTSTTQIATTAFAAGEITTHAGATDPHGDRSFATSAVSTHAALTTGVHGLGGASQLNVGTTAGTVAAGDHAHSGVYQPLATVLTNTTAAFTTAQETKLSGIETAADVTDAGNVGTAIDGATAKATPVDADTVPLIDSAASNVLKKLSWANIKATAKTYFDTLYQAALVSGTNIKTVNATSLLGSGDIAISASPGGSTRQLQYNNAGAFGGANLWFEDANTITQRNSTTAQGWRWSNTWTDSSNNELGVARWTSNVFEIGTVKAGTGSSRNMRLLLSSGGVLNCSAQDVNNWTFQTALRIGFNSVYVILCAEAQYGYSGIEVTKSSVLFGRENSGDISITGEARSNNTYATGTFTIAARGAWASASTNIAGGTLSLAGGAGASGSSGAANGGAVTLDGGRGYGTGSHGDVIVGATRGVLRLPTKTVSALPAATTAGRRCFVSDATATTFHSVVAGGGSNFVPVFSDGTDWRIG